MTHLYYAARDRTPVRCRRTAAGGSRRRIASFPQRSDPQPARGPRVSCGRNYGFYKINIENQTDNENIQISMRERERARSLGGAPDFKPRSEQQMNTEPNDLVVVVELWTIDNVTTLILGWIHVHARCLARPGSTLSPLIEPPYTHTTPMCIDVNPERQLECKQK